MEMVTAVVRAGWLLCLLLSAVETQDSEIFKKVGDEVVLIPSSKPDVMKTILWKDGPNIAMEWDGETIESNRHFKDRGSLDISSGALTIKNLTREDSKRYTPEINSIVGKPIDLKVISPVLQPDISVSCGEGKKTCTFICGGDTTGAEPVNYIWNFNNKQVSSKELILTQEDNENIKEVICEVQNPVSRESSKPIPNPLIETRTEEPESNPKISSGLTVFICLLAVVLLMVIGHKMKSGKWFFEKESMPWEADFWRKTERQQPGTSSEEREAIDEEKPMKV